MGLALDAEKKDTVKAYKQMYEKYSSLTCNEVSGLLQDAYGAIATKLLLGEDSAGLKEIQFIGLLEEAKKLGDLASKCDEVLKLKIKAQESKEALTRGK